MGFGLTTYNDKILPPTGVVEHDLETNTVLLSDGRRMSYENWMLNRNRMNTSQMMYGNSYAISSMGYNTMYSPYIGSSFNYQPEYILPAVPETPEERKFRLEREVKAEKERQKFLTEEQKRREIERRMEEERLAKRTLADLSDESKERFMKVVNNYYKEYKFKEEVKKLMSGFKWILFFLGLAILFNFGHILKIVEMIVTK